MTTEQPQTDSLVEQTLDRHLRERPLVDDGQIGSAIDFNPEPDGPALNLDGLDTERPDDGDTE